MSCHKLNRREFLRLTSLASTGLFLGFNLGCSTAPTKPGSIQAVKNTSLSAFINIDSNDVITVFYKKTEMGQGVRTLVMLVAAEELDARLDQIRVEIPSPSSIYTGMQTGGSYSARYTYGPLREHLAVVRLMLRMTAAQRWRVPLDDCQCRLGQVVNASNGATLGYGELAEAAARLRVPDSAPLKSPESFRYLGKSQPQQHNHAMVTGRAKYGIDHVVEAMQYASLVRAPVVGGKLVSFDDSECRSVPGFLRAVPIRGTKISDFPEYIRDGVAVIASNTWSAMQAAQKLKASWELGSNQNFNTVEYMRELHAMSERPGQVFRSEGSISGAHAQADQAIEATYSGPFLAHAPMEPMNCIASVSAAACEVWVPCHAQDRLLQAIKTLTHLPEEAIQIHTTLMGGSFGRRLQVDYAMEAVLISMAAGGPVKLVWSRSEDMQFGCLRSPYVQKMSGAVKDGRITAFGQQIACSSVWQLREPQMLENGLDYTVIMPAKILPYDIPNIELSQNITALPVPQGWWRASYPSIHHTVQECWIDELIAAAGTDPFDARLSMLANDSDPLEFAWQEGWGKDVIERARLARALRLLRDESGWHRPKAEGQGRGLACSIYDGTYVAQVVELSVRDGRLTLDRVSCVVDCGRALNPDNIKAQMEGGIIFGLSAALYGQISFSKGEVEQGNFTDYRILTIDQTPQIDVHIVESDAAVSGVGEPGAHPIMAATCNAIFDACGKRIRTLPIAESLGLD